jgi:arylsulfatase A-like enzyme
LDNDCPFTHEPTVADELARLDLNRPRDSAVISSWESIERAASAGGPDVVISVGRHHGRNLEGMRSNREERDLLDQGSGVGTAPGGGDFRPDRFTAEIALRYLERESPRFLFIGLGEPDEYAHQGNYRGYLASLRAADDTLGQLMDTLGRMGEQGQHTSVFVTTDHGRSSTFRDHGGFAPESGRVWLVAAGGGVPETGPVRSFEPHRLADIAPTMRALMGLAPDERVAAGKPILGIAP